MQRRSFLATLFAAPAAPLVAKAIAAAPTPPATPEQPKLLCFIAGKLMCMKAYTAVLKYREYSGASVSLSIKQHLGYGDPYPLGKFGPRPYEDIKIVERKTGRVLFCGKVSQVSQRVLPSGRWEVDVVATDLDPRAGRESHLQRIERMTREFPPMRWS